MESRIWKVGMDIPSPDPLSDRESEEEDLEGGY